MTFDFMMGQLLVCMGVLTILIIAIVSRTDHEPRQDLLLCAAVLLQGSVALRFVSWSYAHASSTVQVHAIEACALGLAAGAIVPITASIFLQGRTWNFNINWRYALITIAPMWLAGLFGAATGSTGFLISALTMSLLVAYFLYLREIEARLERDAKRIEHQRAVLLQEQMRPHFLFNSLAAIHELCDSDPDLAASGIENLAGYLRGNLDALAESQLIPFATELEHIRQYVALEHLNPSNDFEVIYDLQEMDFLVPALSIQPLVENAVVHGVRAQEDGMVVVSTDLQGEAVRVVVEDNGPGFATDMPEQQQKRTSRGLANVRQRLASQGNGSLHVNSSPEGTRMVVLLPQGRQS